MISQTFSYEQMCELMGPSKRNASSRSRRVEGALMERVSLEKISRMFEKKMCAV